MCTAGRRCWFVAGFVRGCGCLDVAQRSLGSGGEISAAVLRKWLLVPEA